MTEFKITKKSEKTVLSVRVDADIIKKLDAISNESNISRNQLINDALRYAIENLKFEEIKDIL